eukprot:gene11591-7986_t
MANPYETTGGADPFKEHSAEPSTGSPISLTYAMPTEVPPHPDADTAVLQPVSFQTSPFAGGQPPAQPAQTVAAEPASSASICSVEYYQAYFDITTRQVLNRMTNALFPICPPDYLHGRNWHFANNEGATSENSASEGGDLIVSGVKLSRHPDLYGPFWICTTLWIALGVMGNVMSRIAYAREHGGTHAKDWIFDFALIPTACATIYLYCFLFAAMVWGVMKWKYLPISLVDLICLYGYSMFVFVLIALLCVIPSAVVQWILVLLGGVWSASYLVANLWHMLKHRLSPQWFSGIVGGVVLGHVLLTISFKLYFLHYSI